MLRFESDHRNLRWEDVPTLFQEVGWRARDPEELKQAFLKSSFTVFAFDDDRLVGCGRTIDDGRFYASLVDVVVAPSYQGRGIGSEIVRQLQSRLSSFLIVNLTAAPEVQGFYRRLGWKLQKTAMMHPRSEEQARRNCADD
jgi:ribosomal protein S18 acetylase RimI-like enzyme